MADLTTYTSAVALGVALATAFACGLAHMHDAEVRAELRDMKSDLRLVEQSLETIAKPIADMQRSQSTGGTGAATIDVHHRWCMTQAEACRLRIMAGEGPCTVEWYSNGE